MSPATGRQAPELSVRHEPVRSRVEPEQTARRADGARLSDFIRLVRVKQWPKNAFVGAPLLFSARFMDGSAVVAALLAIFCFCLWSSSVYCLNDVMDAAADRTHPRKKRRPVASGKVRPVVALLLAAFLTLSAVALAYAYLPAGVLVAGLFYLLLSSAYCFGLKRLAIIDVLAIGAGFVVRLEGGCAAIDVSPTSWLMICAFSLTIALGFGKRRLEIAGLARGTEFRAVLGSYSVENLNILLATSVSLCLMSYMLYTMAPETVAIHNTDKLIYTVPFVLYGLLRFVFKVLEGGHDDPVEVLQRDPAFMITGICWVVSLAILFLWVQA